MADIADAVKIEIAFTTAPWATTPTWTDVTAISDSERPLRGVRSVSLIKQRVGAAGGVFQPGTLQVVFANRDADWEQANSGSTFGVANLKRNKKIRVRVSDDSFTGSGTVFVGYIDDIVPTGDSLDATATVTASDLSRLLSEYDVADLVRPAEFTGDRVQAILDEVGVPSGEQGNIQNGTVVMPAATLSSDAWSLMQQCAKAEYGILRINRSGQVDFYERYAMLEQTQFNTRQHSFTEAGGANSQIRMAPITRTLGSIHNVTRVTASRDGGDTTFEYDTTGTNEPPTTPASDGPHGLQVAYDADAEVAAQAWHRGWDFDGQRLEQFEVMLWPEVATGALTALEAGYYEPLTRVEVQSTPIGHSTDWNFEARIEGYAHTITPDEWVCVFNVSPYSTDWQTNGTSLWYEYGDTLTVNDLGAL